MAAEMSCSRPLKSAGRCGVTISRVRAGFDAVRRVNRAATVRMEKTWVMAGSGLYSIRLRLGRGWRSKQCTEIKGISKRIQTPPHCAWASALLSNEHLASTTAHQRAF